jgi:hypothetical protein
MKFSIANNPDQSGKLVFALNPYTESFYYFQNSSFSPAPEYEGVTYKLGQNLASWKSEGQHIYVKIND